MLESEVDAYRVIDTDTHVIEPYDLWTSRVDVGKWGDKVPHVRFDEALQEDAWYFGDNRVGPAAGGGGAGGKGFPAEAPAATRRRRSRHVGGVSTTQRHGQVRHLGCRPVSERRRLRCRQDADDGRRRA